MINSSETGKFEALNNAKEEIKRADHLMFVSLKYTRTVDVIKSLIDRLISTIDNCMLAINEHLKDKKKISIIPRSPGSRVEIIKDNIKNDTLNEYIDFYTLLKKISRAEFTCYKEYRRKVTMRAKVDGKELEVNLDAVRLYYDKTKELIPFVEELVR